MDKSSLTVAEQVAAYMMNPGKGMIVDGVAASEALDTAGELLVVKDCDISTLTVDGTLNYEHRGSDDEGASANDVIGRITEAKKILSAKDCETDQHRKYWKELELPFVYFKGRLFDGAGHKGAQAAAAAMRDMVHAGEPLLGRWSVEGSTLSRSGNKLTSSVARRIAFTYKPANHSAHSGVLADPNGPPLPKGYNESAEPTAKSEPLHPNYTRLGGHTFNSSPALEDPLSKTYTAGGAGSAPSTLTNGAALGVEDFARKSLIKQHLNGARAALRDWDRKSDFKEVLKAKLPEADPAFIDRFADMVQDYKLKKKEAEAPLPNWTPARAKKEAKEAKVQAVKGPVASKDFTPRDQPPDTAETKFPPAAPPLPSPGVAPRKSTGSKVYMDDKAVLHTGEGVFQQSFPTEEYQGKHSAAVYQAILHPRSKAARAYLGDTTPEDINESVHRPWHRAMQSWMILNKLAREKKIPESVIVHAAMFSAMSPNTPVALQELYYGYIQDLIKHKALDPTQPVTRRLQLMLRQGIGSGMQLPEFEHEHYAANQGPLRQAAAEQEEEADPKGVYAQGNLGPKPTHLDEPDQYLLDHPERGENGREKGETPQELAFTGYSRWHPHALALAAHYGDNGREAASMLMQMKQDKDAGDPGRSKSFGMGPKLTRYMLGMLGAGNMIVPDRHMIRSIFNLTLTNGSPRQSGYAENDQDKIKHLTSIIGQRNGIHNHVLEAMDHHFFTKHPAVKHVLQQYPEHFKGHEEQAIFPAFWLHWLTIQHHEKLRGMPYKGFQGGTDHYPFWASIKGILEHRGIPHDDSSFDFGHNLGKAETDYKDLMPVRTAQAMDDIERKHGENAALFAFHSFMLPALLSAEQAEHHWQDATPAEVVRKFEEMAIDLRKAAELTQLKVAPKEPAKIKLDGREIQTGAATRDGGDYHIVHQNAQSVFVVPNVGGQTDYKTHQIQNWPIRWAGVHFKITKPLVTPPPPKIDSTRHAIPEYTKTPEQHALVHGMDLEHDRTMEPSGYQSHKGVNGHDGKAFWMKGGNGQPVYAKFEDANDGPRREVLYHNVAHQFFGLGHYVPTTALIKNPHTGENVSIQEGVHGAEHIDHDWKEQGWHPDGQAMVPRKSHHIQHLMDMGRSGELDKLAIMNTVLGNRDRHPSNWMYTERSDPSGHPGKPQPLLTNLKLIDHGHTFGRSGGWANPTYLDAYHALGYESRKDSDPDDLTLRPIHPAAVEWAKGLDPAKLKELLLQHNAPSEYWVKPVERLKNLHEMLALGVPAIKRLKFL